MIDWVKQILVENGKNKIDSLIIDKNDIIKGHVKETVSKRFHQKMPKGAALRELSESKFHQINWETPYYELEIQRFLIDADNNKPVLDLGCGDGRFTKILLENGFNEIVCVDSDYRLLESLHNFAVEAGFRNKLLIMHTDADELPFKNCVFSVILAIGVLYYLNENEPKTLSNINSLLCKNGLLILSEPEVEGTIFRALLFGNLEDAIDVFDKRVFKEGQGHNEFKFHVKSKLEQAQLISSAKFKIEDTHGITIFHNYLRIMLVRGLIDEKDIAKNMGKLMELFDFLHENGSIFKHIIWKCRKN